jgi:hypothetical protein
MNLPEHFTRTLFSGSKYQFHLLAPGILETNRHKPQSGAVIRRLILGLMSTEYHNKQVTNKYCHGPFILCCGLEVFSQQPNESHASQHLHGSRFITCIFEAPALVFAVRRIRCYSIASTIVFSQHSQTDVLSGYALTVWIGRRW